MKIITNGLDEHRPITQDNYTPTITQKHDDDDKTKTKESPQTIPVLDAGRQNDEKQNEKTSRTGNNEENNEENEENTNEENNGENTAPEINDLNEILFEIVKFILRYRCAREKVLRSLVMIIFV